jgi:hypothetical protein
LPHMWASIYHSKDNPSPRFLLNIYFIQSKPLWLSRFNTFPCSYDTYINLGLCFDIGCPWVLPFGLSSIQLYNCIPTIIWHDVQVAFRFPVDKLTLDPYDVATWHLLFLLPQWCFTLPFRGGATWHREL